ncbi:hypothetical protein KSP39_PZI000526 [Platanthera zijinensis]|uniref:VAN3-binding protein-like auxin canalisation domain-containing protein n=1 Tax=Platanthera zijinensis TaxID=2320716 RepID=A0AAP0C5M9_9ASPA
MDDAGGPLRSESRPAAGYLQPELPLDPMEFLSRSWSTVSAVDVPRPLTTSIPPPLAASSGIIMEENSGEHEEQAAARTPTTVAGNPFSFASAATSQLVLERIMSQSQEVSPLTSGRLSHSSGPLNAGSLTDSPPVSPSDHEDVKYLRPINAAAKPPQLRPAASGARTVGRWLKDRREKKKEESRAHNAQLHAAVSVAGVAAAVAAMATEAASLSSGRDEYTARTDMAVASAATLVAAQCVDAAEAIGAERDHLAAVISSAVNVRTSGDVVTLTAAAATALRAAATLRARALREAWNISAVIPVEKVGVCSQFDHHCRRQRQQKSPATAIDMNDETHPQEDFLEICGQDLLARGTELLKRTRKVTPGYLAAKRPKKEEDPHGQARRQPKLRRRRYDDGVSPKLQQAVAFLKHGAAVAAPTILPSHSGGAPLQSNGGGGSPKYRQRPNKAAAATAVRAAAAAAVCLQREATIERERAGKTREREGEKTAEERGKKSRACHS